MRCVQHQWTDNESLMRLPYEAGRCPGAPEHENCQRTCMVLSLGCSKTADDARFADPGRPSSYCHMNHAVRTSPPTLQLKAKQSSAAELHDSRRALQEGDGVIEGLDFLADRPQIGPRRFPCILFYKCSPLKLTFRCLTWPDHLRQRSFTNKIYIYIYIYS